MKNLVLLSALIMSITSASASVGILCVGQEKDTIIYVATEVSGTNTELTVRSVLKTDPSDVAFDLKEDTVFGRENGKWTFTSNMYTLKVEISKDVLLKGELSASIGESYFKPVKLDCSIL